MDVTFSTFGALVGLALAIILIIKKVHPAYSLIFGALIGGLIGGGGLINTVNTMISGAGSMMSSVLRILTSGILAGALIETGSAQKIAETIVDKLGERRAVAAISIATMVICAVGVFVDISVITVAPIALAIGERAGLSRSGVLLAMIGGGKAGNIISPNPNTIALSEGFNVSLTSLMMKNIVPAICALIVTIILSTYLTKKKGDAITAKDLDGNDSDNNLPAFWKAIAGPLVVIVLLALRPIAGITIDTLLDFFNCFIRFLLMINCLGHFHRQLRNFSSNHTHFRLRNKLLILPDIVTHFFKGSHNENALLFCQFTSENRS